MKEEHVTKSMLKWLIELHWQIVCFDFPQSGTGRIIHPNWNKEEMNKSSIIPDIVAVKNGVCVFVENKDRYYFPDFLKQHGLIVGNDYCEAISSLLKDFSISRIFYGIGLPTEYQNQYSIETANLVDFILGVDENRVLQVLFNPYGIMF